jgi:hypothetical protein
MVDPSVRIKTMLGFRFRTMSRPFQAGFRRGGNAATKSLKTSDGTGSYRQNSAVQPREKVSTSR